MPANAHRAAVPYLEKAPLPRGRAAVDVYERGLMQDEEFGQIVVLAVKSFGNREHALRWLVEPNWGLGAKPLDLLESDAGVEAVTRALSAIEYGGPA